MQFQPLKLQSMNWVQNGQYAMITAVTYLTLWLKQYSGKFKGNHKKAQ